MDKHPQSQKIASAEPACPLPISGPEPVIELHLPALEQGTHIRLIPQLTHKHSPPKQDIKQAKAFPHFPQIPVAVEWLENKGSASPLAIGVQLSSLTTAETLLTVTGREYSLQATHAHSTIRLQALSSLPSAHYTFTLQRPGYTLAWITLSDKGAQGLRQDTSGPLIPKIIQKVLQLRHTQGFLLPDNPQALKTLLLNLAVDQGYDCIICTGGTGIGPRDTTPEVAQSLIDKRLYGFETLMLQSALQKTAHAAISRAVVGCIGTSLLITLPGSSKAVEENLHALLPVLAHSLSKLQGDPADCG